METTELAMLQILPLEVLVEAGLEEQEAIVLLQDFLEDQV
jgi:hypothetical protein